MKKITLIIGSFVFIIVVSTIALLLSVNAIIKGGVEKYAPPITKTTVKLDNSSVSLLSGEASLKGIFIGNPVGFKSDSAFQLDKVSMSVDIASLFGDTINIEKILIDAPLITCEYAHGTSNISTIIDNIKEYSNKLTSGETKPKQPQPEVQHKPEKKVIIGDLFIKNSRINVSHEMLKGKSLSLTLPDIHLSRIGADRKEGKPISDTLDQVISELNKKIISQISLSKGDIATNINAMSQGLKNTLKSKVEETRTGSILDYFKKK